MCVCVYSSRSFRARRLHYLDFRVASAAALCCLLIIARRPSLLVNRNREKHYYTLGGKYYTLCGYIGKCVCVCVCVCACVHCADAKIPTNCVVMLHILISNASSILAYHSEEREGESTTDTFRPTIYICNMRKFSFRLLY